jgi:hypothetical protein
MGYEAQRKIALYTFTVVLLAAEVQILTLALTLTWCGIGWDRETGTFRKVGL